MAQLRWETPSKRDTFKTDLDTKLTNIACYDRNVRHGEDMDGNPQSNVDVRPEQSADADDLYNSIKNKMDNIPVLTGVVHWHDCSHSDPPDQWKPCKIEGKYEK